MGGHRRENCHLNGLSGRQDSADSRRRWARARSPASSCGTVSLRRVVAHPALAGPSLYLGGNPCAPGMRHYALATAALVLAVLLRWLLDPWLGNALPFVTAFGAVAAAVWAGG